MLNTIQELCRVICNIHQISSSITYQANNIEQIQSITYVTIETI